MYKYTIILWLFFSIGMFTFSKGHSQMIQSNKELDTKKVYWGDLHAHSGLSFDTNCSTQELYNFAKLTSSLDFIIASDHDIHSSSSDWEESKLLANSNNEPGEFVAFLGYEWTGLPGEIGGHRIIIYPDSERTRFSFESSLSNNISKITSLVSAEGGLMIVAHSDADNFHANIDFINNSVQVGIELTGVYSNRFEYFGNPNSYSVQVENNSVRDALLKGNTFGAIGSSDSHNCRPGLAGLTAVIADSLTRNSLFESIKNRSVYATTGARIELGFNTEDLKMGNVKLYSTAELPLRVPEFNIWAKGAAELEGIQVIKNSEVVYELAGNGTDSLSAFFEDINPIETDTYYYLKVIQKDGELAWSSPIFYQSEETFLNSSGEESYFTATYYSSYYNELNIEFYLESDKYIEILVYDVLGRKIKDLGSRFYSKGYNNVTSQVQNISSGLYLVQLRGDSILETSKVLIIK